MSRTEMILEILGGMIVLLIVNYLIYTRGYGDGQRDSLKEIEAAHYSTSNSRFVDKPASTGFSGKLVNMNTFGTPTALTLDGGKGKTITIHDNGKVDIGEGFTTKDEASKEFWRLVEKNGLLHRKREKINSGDAPGNTTPQSPSAAD